MTTAARPTWAPAKGGNEQGGTRIFGPSQKYSSRDIASHTTLKPRKEGQDTQDELQRRNLRDELEERERRHFSLKDDRDRRKGGHLLLEGSKREVEDRIVPRNVDADDADVDVKSDDSEDDDDDEEDDEEALLAELELIRKEKAEQKLREEREKQEEELQAKEAELLRGNPLLNNPASFSVKRRWDDDVVFKNQARGETKIAKRFINDTIRNDFHRKFLQKEATRKPLEEKRRIPEQSSRLHALNPDLKLRGKVSWLRSKRARPRKTVARQSYGLLTSIHENFEQIAENILPTDRTRRNVDKVQVDLDAIGNENNLLERGLHGIGICKVQSNSI
ncbi:CWC15 homolog [Olea europaea subsp. europaea]|uniref:CWC15 homolog n=1 Tax=Olea europaea subsp. europaea TaxID=158383 RepID=A0A8S0THF2_OLEEU|nr:CWC15 homolog [Olea europaea subsp. europaea]